MITKFKDFIFSTLNAYFKRSDSYKDINGKGFLERYLESFGEEIDEEIVPILENHLSILDIRNPDPRYINHISESLGSPPDINLNLVQYQNLLSFITSYYGIKGTRRGYEFFFNFLNLNVSITELPYTELRYDQGDLYDVRNEEDNYHYDNACPTCSFYNIEFSNKLDSNNNPGTIDQTLYDNIRLAISYNEPINARLLTLTQAINFEDVVDICFQEQVDVYVVDSILFDDNQEYDNSLTYDELSQTLQHTVTDSSPACVYVGVDFGGDFNNDFGVDFYNI